MASFLHTFLVNLCQGKDLQVAGLLQSLVGGKEEALRVIREVAGAHGRSGGELVEQTAVAHIPDATRVVGTTGQAEVGVTRDIDGPHGTYKVEGGAREGE